MAGEQGDRPQDFRSQLRPMFGKRFKRTAPVFAVYSECRFGLTQVAFEDDCSSVVKRVRDGSRGLNPFQAVFPQRQV